jgi:hypothetical protein
LEFFTDEAVRPGPKRPRQALVTLVALRAEHEEMLPRAGAVAGERPGSVDARDAGDERAEDRVFQAFGFPVPGEERLVAEEIGGGANRGRLHRSLLEKIGKGLLSQKKNRPEGRLFGLRK